MSEVSAAEGSRVTYIYALKDPDSGAVRYVGKTSQEPKRRLQSHLHLCEKNGRQHCAYWVRSLKRCGKRPVMEVLETVLGNHWPKRERFWIEEMGRRGEPLTNHSYGGERACGPMGGLVRTACAWCGMGMLTRNAVLLRRESGRAFCCHSHSTLYTNAHTPDLGAKIRAALERKAGRELRVSQGCAFCGKTVDRCISQARGRRVFCCQQHSALWQKEFTGDRAPRIQAPCANCGTLLSRLKSKVYPSGNAFCNRVCFWVHYNKELAARPRQVTYVSVPCGWCGAVSVRSAGWVATGLKQSKSGKLFCCPSHAATYRHHVNRHAPPPPNTYPGA